jgi:cytochrome P450
MNHELYSKAGEFHFERWLPQDHSLYEPDLANTEEIDYHVMNNKFRLVNMGPNMCLGGQFAKLEVQIVVTQLFQEWTCQIRPNEATAE